MFFCVFVDVHRKINLVRGYSSTLFRCPCALFHCVIMFVCLSGGVHRKIFFDTGYSSTVFRVSVRPVSLFFVLFVDVHRKIIFVTGYSSTMFRVSVRSVSLCCSVCSRMSIDSNSSRGGVHARCVTREAARPVTRWWHARPALTTTMARPSPLFALLLFTTIGPAVAVCRAHFLKVGIAFHRLLDGITFQPLQSGRNNLICP